MTIETSYHGDLPELSPDLLYLEEFTRPQESLIKEESSSDLGENATKKYNHGLVIGRFQPLHRGHIELFKDALALCNSITIGIGSANVVNDENPFSAQVREVLIDRALRREGIRERVTQIVPLDDNESDRVWLESTLRRTGPIDSVFGGNDWINGIFENAGYPVERIPRHGYAATEIRQQLRQQGKLRRG